MPTTSIVHSAGYSSPVLIERIKITRNNDGMDSATARYLSSDSTALRPGMALPNDSRFTIDALDIDDEGDGYYEYDIKATGLITSPKRLVGYPDVTLNTENWDTVTDVVLTTNKNYIRVGSYGNFGGTTYCTSVQPKPMNEARTIWKLTAQYSGLVQSKPYRRTITSNGMKVQGDSITVNLEQGWTTARKGNASLPKITVTDTYWSTTPAPTASVPGMRTPPSAPPVRVLTFTGADITSNWPWGWEFTTGHRQLGASSLYEVDMIYEWVPRYTP